MLFIVACLASAITMIVVRRFSPEQIPDRGDIGGTVAIAEEPIVANSMLAFWQHMDEEPTDKLSRFQRHSGVSSGAFDAVIFDTEGDATLVHMDQAAI